MGNGDMGKELMPTNSRTTYIQGKVQNAKTTYICNRREYTRSETKYTFALKARNSYNKMWLN